MNNDENKSKSYKEISAFIDLNHETVIQAMNVETWDINKLEESLKNKQKEFENCRMQYEYNDDYFYLSNKEIAVYGFIRPFVSCNLDYEEKKYRKYDNINDLIENMKNYFEIEHTSTFEQRLENPALQSPLRSKLFPSFVDVIPQKDKMNRKCKKCGKNIIMASDAIVTKDSESKFTYAHFYIKYFPIISLYKVDLEEHRLLIKFTKLDAKDLSVQIQEDRDNKVKVVIPTGKFEIGGTLDSKGQNDNIFKQTEQFLILIFKFAEDYYPNLEVRGSQHFLKLKILTDYSRDNENIKQIQYNLEIKFTVAI